MIDYKKEFLNSLRLYFAPLVGAWKAVVEEVKRQDEQQRRS